MLVAAVLSFVLRARVVGGGRYSPGQGQQADPNDFALFMLAALPVWWFAAKQARSGIKKILCLLCTAPVLVAFARTGSRGGFVGLCVVMALFFLSGSAAQRIRAVAAIVICGLAGFWLLPHATRQRFVTLYTQQTIAGVEMMDGSAEQRLQLFKTSLRVTLEHPLFGVGPGNFAAYIYNKSREEGGRMPWLPPHNTYTHISSEAGIPALVFFLLAINAGFASMRFIRRAHVPQPSPEWITLVNAAFYLRLTVAGVGSCCFFLTYPYSGALHPLIGLMTAMELIARKELTRMQTSVDAPALPVFATSAGTAR